MSTVIQSQEEPQGLVERETAFWKANNFYPMLDKFLTAPPTDMNAAYSDAVDYLFHLEGGGQITHERMTTALYGMRTLYVQRLNELPMPHPEHADLDEESVCDAPGYPQPQGGVERLLCRIMPRHKQEELYAHLYIVYYDTLDEEGEDAAVTAYRNALKHSILPALTNDLMQFLKHKVFRHVTHLIHSLTRR